MLGQRLREFGFEVSPEEIFTATLAGVRLVRKAGYSRIAPFIPEAALEDMDRLDLGGGTSGRPARFRPDAIMVGDLAERWSYQLLQEAFEYLMDGAELIALSRDRYWLRADRLTLDAGPFVAALEFAADRPARVAGKPSAVFFAEALDSMEIPASREAAMVGDDLWSDVEGAQRAGLQGWLVRTGKYRESALKESGIRPDRVLESVALLD
jgi:HAD superfamily hydrolase (TIGR01458 family)